MMAVYWSEFSHGEHVSFLHPNGNRMHGYFSHQTYDADIAVVSILRDGEEYLVYCRTDSIFRVEE